MKNKRILYIGNDLAQKTKYNTTMQTLSSYFEKEGITVFRFSNRRNKIFRLLDMCLAVVRYCRKVDYMLIDTFSTQNFYYAFLTSQIARVLQLKYIPILHGGNLPARLDRSKRMSSMIFSNSYNNIAPSNYLKTAFEKRGYPTTLIPNIVEIEEYVFKERKELQPKLLWVRAFKDIYNPMLAAAVLAEVKKEYPKALLCMIGPVKDDTYEKTKQLARSLDVFDDIEFTGVLPKEEWHRKSENFDVFINTTNVDNTPVSIMEAMALGIPIVSTNVGGLPYLIDDGIDGILVPKDDPKEMSNAIVRMLKTNDIHLAKNGREKVEKFSWHYVKNQWSSILE